MGGESLPPPTRSGGAFPAAHPPQGQILKCSHGRDVGISCTESPLPDRRARQRSPFQNATATAQNVTPPPHTPGHISRIVHTAAAVYRCTWSPSAAGGPSKRDSTGRSGTCTTVTSKARAQPRNCQPFNNLRFPHKTAHQRPLPRLQHGVYTRSACCKCAHAPRKVSLTRRRALAQTLFPATTASKPFSLPRPNQPHPILTHACTCATLAAVVPRVRVCTCVCVCACVRACTRVRVCAQSIDECGPSPRTTTTPTGGLIAMQVRTGRSRGCAVRRSAGTT